MGLASPAAAQRAFQVKDINPVPEVTGSLPYSLVKSGAFVFFLADDGLNGGALWRSDGTGAGTLLLKGNPDILFNSLTDLNGTLYFVKGYDLWKSYGTPGGTVMVKRFCNGGDGWGAAPPWVN